MVSPPGGLSVPMVQTNATTGATVLVGADGDFAHGGIVPATNDSSGITAAIATVAAQGGGIVRLLPALYTFTEPVTLVSGVHIIGCQPSFSFAGDVSDSSWVPTDGTILAGDRTFAGFIGNNVDQGSPDADYALTTIASIKIAGIVFKDFTYPIDIGATNTPGAFSSVFEDLYDYDTVNGFNFENFLQCTFRRMYSTSRSSDAGGMRFASTVTSGVLHPGNAVFDLVFRHTTKRLHKGIDFYSVSGGNLNELTILRIQCNKFGQAESSESVSLTNTSADITVADASIYPVDYPVIFTTTANGFTLSYVYFVVYSSGTTIRLGNYFGASAIVATGTGSMTMKAGGWPNITMRGDGAINNSVITGMDLESVNSISFVGRNLSNVKMHVQEVMTAAHQHVVLRVATNCIVTSANSSLKTDWDNGASGTTLFGKRGTITNRIGTGFWNGHIFGTPGASIASGAANGTTGTATMTNSTDISGTFTITPGGTGIGAGTVATVTFGTAKELAYVALTPMNAAANALQVSANALRMQDPSRSTGFDMITDGALVSGTAYKFGWISV